MREEYFDEPFYDDDSDDEWNAGKEDWEEEEGSFNEEEIGDDLSWMEEIEDPDIMNDFDVDEDFDDDYKIDE